MPENLTILHCCAISVTQKGGAVMDQKQAEKEIEYRIGKILLATMMAEGLISQSESDVAQCYLRRAEKQYSRQN